MQERRQFARYSTLIEIRYSTADSTISGYCFTKDLSRGGTCLPLDKYISPYTRLQIEIFRPDGQTTIILKGIVVWAKKNKLHWQSNYSAGLQFDSTDVQKAKEVDKLINFASSHQWEKTSFESDLEKNKIPVLEL